MAAENEQLRAQLGKSAGNSSLLSSRDSPSSKPVAGVDSVSVTAAISPALVNDREAEVVQRKWHFNPHSGGRPVPGTVRQTMRTAILDHAEEHFAGRYREIDVRFRAQFCYVDAYLEPVEGPTNGNPARLATSAPEPVRDDAMALCRLRFFDRDRWSFALYSYAQERYDPAVFGDGEFFGLAVDGFDLAANLYLP